MLHFSGGLDSSQASEKRSLQMSGRIWVIRVQILVLVPLPWNSQHYYRCYLVVYTGKKKKNIKNAHELWTIKGHWQKREMSVANNVLRQLPFHPHLCCANEQAGLLSGQTDVNLHEERTGGSRLFY